VKRNPILSLPDGEKKLNSSTVFVGWERTSVHRLYFQRLFIGPVSQRLRDDGNQPHASPWR